MNTKAILKYLTELSENNNREWYHAHKSEYKEANSEFESLVQALILKIGEFDSSVINNIPKELTFKLNRDTRFSHDKSPYNPAFRAHISSMGKMPIPVGYYFMIKPNDQSFIGGGLFADMFKDATAMVREHISRNGDEWEKIINGLDFRKNFKVQGASLKNVPSGYEKDHPQAEYLKAGIWNIQSRIRSLTMRKCFLRGQRSCFE